MYVAQESKRVMSDTKPQRGQAYSRTIQRMWTGAHRFWYRLTGGRVGGQMGQSPVLILTTFGRVSGKMRSTPLFYLAYEGAYVIVASNGGSVAPPLWRLNLQAHPEATIQVGANTMRVRARDADEDERAALWPQLVAMFSNYAVYQSKVARVIPVIILDVMAGR